MAQYRVYKDTEATYRIGVRNASFVFDQALTETGFAGSENTDWENLTSFKKE